MTITAEVIKINNQNHNIL